MDFKKADSGFFGKAFEIALHEYLGRKDCRVRAAGRVDERIDHKNYEIKTGAGELANYGDKLVKGVSRVIYVPVPSQAWDGNSIDLWKVEGFVLTRENFLQALDNAGAIRRKVSTAGAEKVTIQTFWNNSQNKPHGRLLDRILDQMYDLCDMTFEEFLDRE